MIRMIRLSQPTGGTPRQSLPRTTGEIVARLGPGVGHEGQARNNHSALCNPSTIVAHDPSRTTKASSQDKGSETNSRSQ